MNPTILIADDHPLVLKGLYDFLIENEYNIVATAKNGKEALSLIKALNPDIAILDIQMPFYTGLDIARICKEQNLSTKISLITFEKEERIYNEAIALNVYGYILKEFALDEIESCITSMLKNETYFSPELSDFIEPDKRPKELESLTLTEKQILELMAKNLTAKEIGESLFCSNRTVEKHKGNIIKKLNIEPARNSLVFWVKENQHYFI